MVPTREYVLKELTSVRAMLRSFGVQRIAVFGSVARNTATANSDIDILADFPRGQVNAARLFGLQDFLAEHFQRKVDVITVNGLKPYSRGLVMRDAVFIEDLHETEAETEKSLSQV